MILILSIPFLLHIANKLSYNKIIITKWCTASPNPPPDLWRIAMKMHLLPFIMDRNQNVYDIRVLHVLHLLCHGVSLFTLTKHSPNYLALSKSWILMLIRIPTREHCNSMTGCTDIRIKGGVTVLRQNSYNNMADWRLTIFHPFYFWGYVSLNK